MDDLLYTLAESYVNAEASAYQDETDQIIGDMTASLLWQCCAQNGALSAEDLAWLWPVGIEA